MRIISGSVNLWRGAVLVLVSALGLATGLTISSSARNSPEPQQDVIRLENRMNQVEQRLYSMETILRTVEQQSRLAGVNSRGVNPRDLDLLRTEIQLLQRRVEDDECGLAKLDERTLTAEARNTRRNSGSDPCRLNANAPLRLPDRNE